MRHFALSTLRRTSRLLVFVCVFGVFVPPAFAVTATEAKLRAAIIVGIMRFTSWPNIEKYNDATSLNVCLVGKPTSQDYLLPVNGERKIAGKGLSVQSVPASEISSCHVVVLGEGVASADLDSLLAQADAGAMLSVCDGCRKELSSKPIIHLTLRKQKVNFGVNLARAKQTGVLLDAQLLELASEVRK